MIGFFFRINSQNPRGLVLIQHISTTRVHEEYAWGLTGSASSDVPIKQRFMFCEPKPTSRTYYYIFIVSDSPAIVCTMVQTVQTRYFNSLWVLLCNIEYYYYVAMQGMRSIRSTDELSFYRKFVITLLYSWSSRRQTHKLYTAVQPKWIEP